MKENGKSLIINGFITFTIGAIAGASPFIFIQMLPRMLQPNIYFDQTNYFPILITGLLVGIITCIFFTKSFSSKEPYEIFMTSL
jgi:hypothetical protein